MELNKITVKFENGSPHPLPAFAKDGDSGMDIRAWITQEETEETALDDDGNTVSCKHLKPLERYTFHTGIKAQLPPNVEIQVRSRSGKACKQAWVVINQPGTVDNKYGGEIKVTIINLSMDEIIIRDGERIAQLVCAPVYLKELVEIEAVDKIQVDGNRQDSGHGLSGNF